jgi:hypothetical protein
LSSISFIWAIHTPHASASINSFTVLSLIAHSCFRRRTISGWTFWAYCGGVAPVIPL